MSRAGPAVLAVATASPPHRVPQHELRAFARRFFAGSFPAIDRLLPAFDNSGIGERQMASPVEWFDAPHTFVEKNAVYCRCALDMARRAGAEALRRAAVSADEIAALVFVSTTGIATPSLDSYLVQLLGMSRATARVPLWGLGCAGGAAGLARAADLVRALGRPVLLIASEVCSATFVHGDRSKSNLIATALFGDGAAAAVLAPGHDDVGLRILGSHTHLIDDSDSVMGWTLEPEGLRVRFARSIPDIVRKTVPAFARAAAEAAHLDVGEVTHYVLHPGGARVLAAYEAALAISPAAHRGGLSGAAGTWQHVESDRAVRARALHARDPAFGRSGARARTRTRLRRRGGGVSMVSAQGLLAGLLAFVLVQRAAELRLARHNEAWARAHDAQEFGAGHYRVFFLLHGAWLLMWLIEASRRGPQLAADWTTWLLVFVAAQGLRYWTIATLGPRWNTRILVVPGLAAVARGPYRFLRHPNYVAVGLELAALPLIFGAWHTALVIGLANLALLLGVRVPAEMRALRWAGSVGPRSAAPPR